MCDPAALAASDLVAAYAARTLSPVETVEACFARIDRFEPAVNAFVIQDRERALEAARRSEARWFRRAPLGLGDGVPATIKDNIHVAGLPCRFGSRITDARPVESDAPAVAKLKAAGCILLGKTTLPDFAWKATGDSPLTGSTRNPWDLACTSGGSSAGAGAAAALGFGAFHLGTDGGGSIRIPASFNGIVGFKPSFGRVAADPPSVMGDLAHLGPMARTVRDAARMLAIIAEPDRGEGAPGDSGLSVGPGEMRGMRIAWSPTLGFATRLDPEVARLTEAAARTFADLGAVVEEIEPGFDDPLPLFDTLWTAGAALALEGHPPEARCLLDPGFLAAARSGESVTGVAVISALTRGRSALRRCLDAVFARYSLLLTPQTAVPALPVGRETPVPGFAGRADWGSAWTAWSPFTYLFNLTQVPAISVPCGLTAAGLPVGLQIVGPLRADTAVMCAAHAFECARPFGPLDAPRRRDPGPNASETGP